MTKEDLLKEFPAKRIKPVDGMAVTAEVWEEAHSYHRQHQQFHDLFYHGTGIVTGLKVIASDPPDSAVYLLPGTAVDSRGQSIVLVEPLSYDIGRTQEGLLYLVLTYGESRPKFADSGNQEGAPLYVSAEYGVQASPALPDTPYVELARIRRRDRNDPILDAKDPAHPGPNEIDLRFRREIGAVAREMVTVAVVRLGKGAEARHTRGANYLARAVSHVTRGEYRVCVDEEVPLADGLANYTLVYLVGQAAFQLSPSDMNALHTYVQAGGTILMESCRHETASGAPASDASFTDLLGSMGIKLEELRPGHDLLLKPAFFAVPPPGFETQGKVQAGQGVIFSTFDYGCLWQGERRGGTASREEIRAAMEFGENLLAYALERRRQATTAA